MKITNWGNYPVIDGNMYSFSSEKELLNILQESSEIIPRGLGRCYGDSSLNREIISTKKFNRFLNFDEKTGILTCESGISLSEIIDVFVPRGYFLPVTPGTKFVTLGGAVASDVHGKNHHKSGSISSHIYSLKIMLDDGNIIKCSPDKNADLFHATCGGMGLTGIILEVSLKLIPVNTSYILQETWKAENLDEILEYLEQSLDTTYSVAWIDCLAKNKNLGRSVLIKGEHALKEDLFDVRQVGKPLDLPGQKNKNIPLFLPEFSLNPLTVKAFNFLYYYKLFKKVTKSVVDFNTFFYPLDNVLNWNRIYGKRGFIQYQFVLPKESKKGFKKILTKIAESGQGSFLAVLKLFGKQDGILSFPFEGYTLALDFPVKKGVLKFLDELDLLVLEYGGRLYLTKDARMNGNMFKSGYENLDRFLEIREKYCKTGKFQSLQSKRLGI